jgi:hypothetical protein
MILRDNVPALTAKAVRPQGASSSEVQASARLRCRSPPGTNSTKNNANERRLPRGPDRRLNFATASSAATKSTVLEPHQSISSCRLCAPGEIGKVRSSPSAMAGGQNLWPGARCVGRWARLSFFRGLSAPISVKRRPHSQRKSDPQFCNVVGMNDARSAIHRIPAHEVTAGTRTVLVGAEGYDKPPAAGEV